MGVEQLEKIGRWLCGKENQREKGVGKNYKEGRGKGPHGLMSYSGIGGSLFWLPVFPVHGKDHVGV